MTGAPRKAAPLATEPAAEPTYRERAIARLAAEEAAREAAQPKHDVLAAILDDALPHQRAFILDPALYKVVCCERRAGKSTTIALALILEALRTPKAKCLYLGLSNESCERIMWTDVLEPLLLQHGIQAQLMRSRHEVRFANGSVVYLQGCDASPQQKNKIRGQAFDLVAIDEAQDFKQDLAHLIEAVLAPTLAQRAARLLMVGTPSNNQGLHYFYFVNRPDTTDKKWKRFRFYWRDNTKRDKTSGLRVCDAVKAQLDAEIAANPLVVETPRYRQEWCGEWCIETSARIYRYEPQLNDFDSIPEVLPPSFWATAWFILGFDLGYSPDPTALVVAAYNKAFSPNLYVLSSEEHLEMNTADLADRIRVLDQTYHFKTIVGDCANLNVISDLQRTYGIPIQKADKHGKLAHQILLNSDFQTNQVRLYQPDTVQLSTQLQKVTWDVKARQLARFVEDPKHPNHCTDALLYLHFYAQHHWFRAAPGLPGVDQGSDMDQRIRNAFERTRNRQTNWAEPNR